MNELNVKINIPEGYVIDKEKSTFENIVLKPIKVDYDFISKKLFYNQAVCYITNTGKVGYGVSTDFFANLNNCTSEKQAKKLLAINQLMNVAKYLNGDWKPNWNIGDEKYSFLITNNTIYIKASWASHRGSVYFKTEKLAKQAIKILGEETIKLALSTDW